MQAAWRQIEPDTKTLASILLTGLAFLVLFWQPMVTLGRDWLHDPEAGHGLLLFPIAIWLIWKRGVVEKPRPQWLLGSVFLLLAVLLRYASGLAAELFTMRMSMLGALGALTIFALGWRQLLHWWLPVALLLLSVPIPEVILGSLALPLQLKASALGASLLEWRHVPVALAGNVLRLPGQTLFVTEACSGLRSLTALLALGVLIGGLWLKRPVSRILLIAVAIPVAIVLNGVRVFLTGFLVYFVNPALGEGFMHYTEGWAIFVLAFLTLGAVAWGMSRLELLMRRQAA